MKILKYITTLILITSCGFSSYYRKIDGKQDKVRDKMQKVYISTDLDSNVERIFKRELNDLFEKQNSDDKMIDNDYILRAFPFYIILMAGMDTTGMALIYRVDLTTVYCLFKINKDKPDFIPEKDKISMLKSKTKGFEGLTSRKGDRDASQIGSEVNRRMNKMKLKLHTSMCQKLGQTHELIASNSTTLYETFTANQTMIFSEHTAEISTSEALAERSAKEVFYKLIGNLL